jgi:hypothetical protein
MPNQSAMTSGFRQILARLEHKDRLGPNNYNFCCDIVHSKHLRGHFYSKNISDTMSDQTAEDLAKNVRKQRTRDARKRWFDELNQLRALLLDEPGRRKVKVAVIYRRLRASPTPTTGTLSMASTMSNETSRGTGPSLHTWSARFCQSPYVSSMSPVFLELSPPRSHGI